MSFHQNSSPLKPNGTSVSNNEDMSDTTRSKITQKRGNEWLNNNASDDQQEQVFNKKRDTEPSPAGNIIMNDVPRYYNNMVHTHSLDHVATSVSPSLFGLNIQHNGGFANQFFTNSSSRVDDQNRMMPNLFVRPPIDALSLSSVGHHDSFAHANHQSYLDVNGVYNNILYSLPSGYNTDNVNAIVPDQHRNVVSDNIIRPTALSYDNVDQSSWAQWASRLTDIDGGDKKIVKEKKKRKKDLSSSSSLHTFPSCVKSLLSTGFLEGVPVKYVSWAREKELRGVINGIGYLCSCPDCNLLKCIHAEEFERHAGCNTKHANSNIYFESGKTIAALVQQLRNTPYKMFSQAIQDVTGKPLNLKNFKIWKASHPDVARELEDITE